MTTIKSSTEEKQSLVSLESQKSLELDDDYGGNVEKFIATIFAPEVMTHQGRILVLFTWIVMSIVMLNGALSLETNFSMEFFIPPGSNADKYY